MKSLLLGINSKVYNDDGFLSSLEYLAKDSKYPSILVQNVDKEYDYLQCLTKVQVLEKLQDAYEKLYFLRVKDQSEAEYKLIAGESTTIKILYEGRSKFSKISELHGNDVVITCDDRICKIVDRYILTSLKTPIIKVDFEVVDEAVVINKFVVK